MKTKKENAQSAQFENVNNVINLISKEAQSLGAVVRNFISVAENNDFAAYMLRTICKHETPVISLTVNEIKKRVIACYPYKDSNNTLLKKENDLYVPIDNYTGDIIRKAFYNAVGATKETAKDFIPATAEQIAKHKEEKEEKKAQKKAENEQKKARTEMYEAFYNELMQCKNMEEAWTIIRTHKANESK